MSEPAGTSPEPTAEEAVAIAAALQVVMAAPSGAAAGTAPSRWRWSGRWWTQPVPARRDRPV